MMTRTYAAALAWIVVLPVAVSGAELKALIVDGQNNHGVWPKTSVMMAHYLRETGLFSVFFARTQFTWQGESLLKQFALPGVTTTPAPRPKADPSFRPKFSDYDVVISNFGNATAPWPKATQRDFENYMRSGGGLVVVHAADNAFGDWKAYNEMIGLGGWGGRNQAHGPYIYLSAEGKRVRDNSAGNGGHHGSQHAFSLLVRDGDHPITRGMPREWMHARDELYDKLRGPGANLQILATAFADPKTGGSGRHEPMLMTIKFGKGRVFHTPLGHADYSQECVGFIVCLQRGAEWAATGKVTQAMPADFPTAGEISSRPFTAAGTGNDR